MDGWCHVRPKVWWGMNWVRQETGPRYVHSKFVQLPNLLTMWDYYLSKYIYKDSTEGDESNKERFWEIGFLDVMMWCFMDVLKAVCDESPILQTVSGCWSKNILTLFEGKLKDMSITLVCILSCSVKDATFTCGVKHERKRMKKSGIQEMRYKDAKFTYDLTDLIMSFFGRLLWKEVYAYVGDVWVK